MKTNPSSYGKLFLLMGLMLFTGFFAKAQRPDTIVCVGSTYNYHFDYTPSVGADSAVFEYQIDGSVFRTSADTIIPFVTSTGGLHTILILVTEFDITGAGMGTTTYEYIVAIDNCGFDIGANTIACIEGPCVHLADLSISPAISYEWYIDGAYYSSANDTFFCPNTEGTYTITCMAMSGGAMSIDTMIVTALSCQPHIENDTTICIGSCINVYSHLTSSPDFAIGYTLDRVFSGLSVTSSGDSASICSPPGAGPESTMLICTNYVLIGGVYYEYSDTLVIDVISCDSVWPGDADYDGIANNYDVLALGIAYGSTGPARLAADNLWNGHYAPFSFTGSFADGINYKNADCNGDGMVDDLDTVAIVNNYGFTHARGGGSIIDTIAPDLYIQYNFDTIIEGALATGDIILGNGADMTAYGLALTMTIDTSIININTFNADFSSSWLTAGDGAINMSKIHTTSIDIAHTGKNHINKTGHGVVAHFSYYIQDNISGKVASDAVKLFKSNVLKERVVTADGTPIDITVNGDKAYAKYQTTSISNLPYIDNEVSVYPNPSSNFIYITFANANEFNIHLQDQLGNNVLNSTTNQNTCKLDISSLSSGIYFLKIEGPAGISIKKIVKK